MSMMTKNMGNAIQIKSNKDASSPSLRINKLGIISRDYNYTYENEHRDFSQVLSGVLKLLDQKGCDTAIFSLFSVVPRKSFDPYKCFDGLKNIKAVLFEEFKDARKRERGRYVVYYLSKGWQEYDFLQQFGTLSGKKEDDIINFVDKEIPKRIMGNCCVLLCGETNGVKYSPKDKKVHDVFELRKSISKTANIILNPIHDRMTRFEMKLKRMFLSENNRWVISVWNKGKKDRNGKSKDGSGPAWTVFCNRKEITVTPIENKFKVEVGILNIV
jgi:hypothetical protein